MAKSNQNNQPLKGRALFTSNHEGKLIIRWIDVKDLALFQCVFLTNAKRVTKSRITCPQSHCPVDLLRGLDGMNYVLYVDDYSVRKASNDDMLLFNKKISN
uniref:Uncharacterized protein n=1 Tax=Aliivibrio wodanis TaxID=80852 RepID=A0A5Q4ZYI4_9GAMM|nr:hypothetical protein [Aliivibrio wodanis]VVV06931.1 hypothetical protein AW0309160_04425 [Aliivibrio wodanis]